MNAPSDGAYEALMQFLYRAPIGLAETNLQGDIEMLNPMSAQLLMPLASDGALDNLFVVLGGVRPQLAAEVASFSQPEGVICESVRIPLDLRSMGSDTPQVLSFSLWKLSATRLMAVLADVTLEVQREQEGMHRVLKDASRIDTLTQMPNRVVVHDTIQESMSRAPLEGDGQMAVLFLNCDRFKQINDTYGHLAGDEVLGLMADRLRSTLRQHDRVVRPGNIEPVAARIGGDEFVVVLNDLHRADDVHVIARRLLDLLAKPYGIGPHQLNCTFSMGVVLRSQAVGDADAVLQDASIAMVEAKRAGGARYVIFEPAMQARAARRGDLESDLRKALVEEQLFVVYQPVVALQDETTARCSGVEALVRWRHPTRGLVMPLEFITVAEECGLIAAVGEYVLRAACRQFAQWQRELGPLAPETLAVNLSRAQLGREEFVDDVREVLRSSGMSPRQLQFEVTESLAAQDELVQARLHELKGLGLTLALDDFGTGYSSLASLHQLPVDAVKIDQSFVRLADTNYHHRVLIEATVLVAASLGMRTVAEGIETEAQAAMVRQLGCDKGQGYLFCRPLEAREVTAWLSLGAMVGVGCSQPAKLVDLPT